MSEQRNVSLLGRWGEDKFSYISVLPQTCCVVENDIEIPTPPLSSILIAGNTGVGQHTWCHVVLGNERRALCMLGKHSTN